MLNERPIIGILSQVRQAERLTSFLQADDSSAQIQRLPQMLLQYTTFFLATLHAAWRPSARGLLIHRSVIRQMDRGAQCVFIHTFLASNQNSVLLADAYSV